MRRRVWYAIAAVLVAMALSCTVGPPPRTPLENAKLSFVDASLAYETVMETLVDLRAKHLLTDEQWARVDRLQVVAHIAGPKISAALSRWETTGVEPGAYADTLSVLLDVIDDLKAIPAEVK